jgi:hypothetical protein
MSSAILATKLIKSWYDAVVKEQEATKHSQVQTDLVQHWLIPSPNHQNYF